MQIAGIVRSRRVMLTTGNARHFRDAGIRLIDPWKEAPTVNTYESV